MPFALIDRWLSPPPDPRKVEWVGGHSYAHRGLHGAGVPENSRAAFARAMAAGCGIELDVQRSSDGLPVVFHDGVLDRLTAETGPLDRRSAAQLGGIALAGSRETIPTLRQVLADVAGRVPVLIEVKSERDARVAAICLAVRRVLEGYTGPHAVMSFDPRVGRWYAKHSPHTVRGLVVSEGEDRALPGAVRRRLALWHARPDFLAYDVRDLPSRFAAGQRRRGLPVVTWTVKDAEHRQRAADHADAGIFEGPVPAVAARGAVEQA
ncbi:glycerophosphodiester phosphodiesterase family protein [Novosphingobium mangrovi (ex Huang et al. 2023)]|uniref:Glycerophosphodiester phosphodiesterase family protein n=1 Tax=Novosphingobium mangrovi (ex Huang et al. 2023) TaxID=2976432 RepID=A0ABT2I341_9SPHN|nr:glycerophosphodiester phosphodiesterase family protein [Novosphingobium mangrovi (ex Huang et al. 2023)]MCT2399225.1 glycerophosphodiester phosphodiesterase family protein [Novosphingobium mangrovi (ex Huang et al. 2023)]